ncbi:MAG: hypothetical protein ACO3CQ_04810 [Candidatus Nanopelagicaceae bacterium]
MADKQITILEGIIEDIAIDLFKQWSQSVPEDQRTEDNLKTISENARSSTIYVVQEFMNRFNKAAEEIKNQ